jgi:acetate kinase
MSRPIKDLDAKLGCITPERAGRACILTINVGSASLKFALFVTEGSPRRLLSGRVERIGMPGSRLLVVDPDDGREQETMVKTPHQAAALQLLIELLEYLLGLPNIAVIGHRLVHGGSRFHRPERITPEFLNVLREIDLYEPDYLSGEINAIEAFLHLDPCLPQVACFDTNFHHDLPGVARIIPIPRRYEAAGVRRYGFHGLSYTYLMEELARVAGPGAARGRVILAHLGSGASLAAVRGGRCIETTMSFTPTSGLVMGTRCGDLDPEVARFLIRSQGMTIDEFHHLVNRESGLLGVSETSSDFRDLLSRRHTDFRAAEAVTLFCYRTKTALGAMAAALGGLDTLVFAGGIGASSPDARDLICAGMEFLGIVLDENSNAICAPVISARAARVAVRVIPTDEELIIARTAAELLAFPRAGTGLTP